MKKLLIFLFALCGACGCSETDREAPGDAGGTELRFRMQGVSVELPAVAAPAAAGAILSWGTLRAALMTDIATAVVGIGILSAVVIPFEKRENTPSMLSEMKIGIVYAVKEAFIGQLLLVFGLFIFLCVPAGILATQFVNRY